jgi:cell division protein FtsI (penicillin-binding protein 3)
LRSRRQAIHLRIKILGACVLALFALLIVRAAHLQLIKGDVLRALADQQQNRKTTTQPHRGEILDRAGEELAVSLTVDSVYADPRGVVDVPETAKALAAILERSPSELEDLLRRPSRFVWIERLLDPPVAEAVRGLELKGIHFTKESKRYYPNDALMGQLLGFVGMDSNGLEGVERAYDKYILSKPKVTELRRDALGRGISVGGLGDRLSAGGYRVQLTVDKAISWEAQKALDETVTRHRARSGVAIVQDVDTGAILAMVTSPSFDPNEFSRYPAAQLRNRAVSDVYEPGSTVKALLIAAALEEKVIRPDTLVFCENGQYQVANRRIHDTKKHAWLTASQVVKHSSNIGSLKIGRMLGRDTWHRYLRDFGLGERTGIDLLGEGRGLMRPVNQWNEVLLATASYGQGIAATPLQIVNAMSAIANGGRLMKPYIVERVIDENGQPVFQGKPEVRGRPISSGTATAVGRILETVVEEGGTGTQAAVAGYYVAGKTGTAQMVDAATGLYSRERYLASFAGYIPARDPRVAIYVSVDGPHDAIYGGVVVGKAFAAIAKRAMLQLRVPPDRPVLPDAVSKAPATRIAEASVMPDGIDFTGMTLREAVRLAASKQVSLVPRGSGFAHAARCAEHTCEVHFRPL